VGNPTHRAPPNAPIRAREQKAGTMINRKTLLAVGLAGAVGWPVLSDSDFSFDSLAGKFSSSASDGAAGDHGGESSADGVHLDPQTGAVSIAALPRIDGYPAFQLAEVFNFDATPTWIMSRWSRVSTQVGSPKFQCYRAPLVSGASRGDVVGTVTYAFNDQQKMQRLTFLGSTDDPTRLVDLLERRFGFEPAQGAAPGEHLFEIRWNGTANSRLKIRMADVIGTDRPFERFRVDLEINLPDVEASWDEAKRRDAVAAQAAQALERQRQQQLAEQSQ
jgi:hypothetical protein